MGMTLSFIEIIYIVHIYHLISGVCRIYLWSSIRGKSCGYFFFECFFFFFFDNFFIVAGPYAGLVPDTVHQLQIGKASGYYKYCSRYSISFNNSYRYTGLAAASGYLVGLVSAGLFSRDYSFWRIYSFLGGCFITFALVTIIFFKEPPKYVL